MLSPIHEAADQIRQQRLTPIDLLETCLSNIDRYEDRVRAWVAVERDSARATAKQRTDELARGRHRGPLHGIPIGVKDIFDVFDWPTGCGSRLWAQSVARKDATVVERLRQAGAVLVGKTVTTAFASFDPPVTRNPWDLKRTPGGSSSGSAAAVACGMCLGALASQTGGSITRPASYCGVAGCKPTYRRVSSAGVMAFAPSMDHPGPIAGCVRDLAILLQAIGGPDPYDPICSRRPMPDLVATLDEPVPVPRIGRVRGLFDVMAEAEMRTLLDRVEDKFRAWGATVVPAAMPGAFAEVLAHHRTIMAVEAASYHGQRLRRHPDDYPPNVAGLIEEGLSSPAAAYQRAKELQKELSRDVSASFREVDVLLTPATRGPAPDPSTTGDPAFNSPWSFTGLPTVSFTAGWTADGLPLAIQLVGPAWSEADLFAAAAWCESALELERREPPV